MRFLQQVIASLPGLIFGIIRPLSFAGAIALLGAGAPPIPSHIVTNAQQREDPEVSPLRMSLRSTGATVTPYMSDAFADSFGVNTRFGQGIYEQQREVVANMLVELGFRHIRDGGVIDKPATRAFLQSLCTQHGIHSSMGLNDNQTDAEILQYIKDVPCVDMVEAPNELNGKPNWLQRLVTFVPHVSNLIHNSPAFAGIPLVAPSITRLDDAQTLGQALDLSKYVDYGNKHSYPGQRNIGGDEGTGARGFGSSHAACPNYAYGSYFFSFCVSQVFTKDRPIWTTETGYGSTPQGLADPGKHPPYGSIPYDVAAKYFPRLMAYEFANGITRTYIFSLVDGASGCNGPFNTLGLVAQDCPNTGSASSLHKKPPFYALKNLFATVTDPGPTFATTPITLKIGGGDAKLHTLLLQKRNHQYLLLYWVEGSAWNVVAGAYTAVEPEHVTVAISGMGNQTTAREFGIDKSGNLTNPQPVAFAGSSARLTATDEIHFLTFDPPTKN